MVWYQNAGKNYTGVLAITRNYYIDNLESYLIKLEHVGTAYPYARPKE